MGGTVFLWSEQCGCPAWLDSLSSSRGHISPFFFFFPGELSILAVTHIDTFEPLWEALLYGTCTHAMTSILPIPALLDLLFCCRWFILKAVPKCTISILALTEVIPYRRLLTIKLSINALLLLPQTGSPSIHGPERWMSWFMSQSHFGVFLYVRCKPLTANALTISWFKTLVATHINIALGLIESHWKSLCTWG